MLKLRKILLLDFIYYLLCIISIIILVIRLSIPKYSIYSEKSHTAIGIVEEIKNTDDKITITLKNKEKVLGTFYKTKEQIPHIQLGDTLKITGTFKKPSTNTTNYLFNYQIYCKRKNIFYLVEIDSLTVEKKNNNSYYYLKQKCINYLKNPYLKIFLLGDKSDLKEEVKKSYQENGISHLFAISGMHITLLVNLLSKILKKLKIEEKTIFQATMFLLLIYLSLIGLTPSIVRAILFYFLFSLNKLYYFYIKPLNLFLLTFAISLFINPNDIFNVGYLYSYVISFTLIASSKELESNNYFISLWKVSVYAFLVSIPITIYYFYQINILGVFYNLLFVPLISMIVFPMSLLVSLISPLEPIYNVCIVLLEKTSLLLNQISIGKLLFKRIPTPIYLIDMILLFLFIIKKRKKYLFIFLGILLIHYSLPFFDQRQYIKMIDVGQGDSILLHSKNKNILVDTGGFETFGSNRDGTIFYHTLEPLLRSEGIHKLDYLILTHGDKDHLGEASTLVKNMKVEKIIINDNKMNYYERNLPKKKVEKGIQGYSINIGNIKMIQLNEDLEDENDSSQIYYVIFNNIRILLTGDASKKSEEVLLNNYEIEEIDILKAGHHGSKTSTSEELLKETKPKLVLISCGKDNKFKHPSTETIKLLNKYNIPYLRTDEKGTITINMNSKQIITDG